MKLYVIRTETRRDTGNPTSLPQLVTFPATIRSRSFCSAAFPTQLTTMQSALEDALDKVGEIIFVHILHLISCSWSRLGHP